MGGGCHSIMIAVLMLLSWANPIAAAVDCVTVTGLLSACSTFITCGSPCCDAVANLDLIADFVDNRKSVCSCLMGLITTYNPHSTAIATLPGFCGVTPGFTIDPNTDCNLIERMGNYRARNLLGGYARRYMELGRSNKKLSSATENG